MVVKTVSSIVQTDLSMERYVASYRHLRIS